jgi:hypothetical protein
MLTFINYKIIILCMKRLIIFSLCLVLLSVGALAESSLEEGQSKDFNFGGTMYNVKVVKILEESAVFEYNGERQEIVGDKMRVRFIVDIETFDCGRFRCFPGQVCLDSGCANMACGDGTCGDSEHCGNCEKDCGCDGGLECIEDSCIKVNQDVVSASEKNEVVADSVNDEIVVEEKVGFFRSIINWFKQLFS